MTVEDPNRFRKMDDVSSEGEISIKSAYSYTNPINGRASTIEIPFSRNVSQLLESIAQIRGGENFNSLAMDASGPIRELHASWPVPWGPNLTSMTSKQLQEKITSAQIKIQSTRDSLKAEDAEAVKILDDIQTKLNQLMTKLTIS